jgi:galactonate dehydratase
MLVKITDLKTFLVGIEDRYGIYGLTIVKLETDSGLCGWGEAYSPWTPRSREPTLNYLKEWIKGKDPFQIKRIWEMLYRDFLCNLGGIVQLSALSAIDIALYDIVGKMLKTPVYNLIGGKFRDRIRVYDSFSWHTGRNTTKVFAEEAASVAKAGFTAIKWGPFGTPFPGREHIRMGIECVRAVREAVGDDVDILIDCSRNLTPRGTITVARELAKYNIFWLEEPVASDNLDALARITANVSMPTVTGEMLYTKWALRQALEKQAADIINPDVGAVGGITEMKEVSAMAQAYDVLVSPHNLLGPIGTSASLHLAASIPNFLILENWRSPGTMWEKVWDDISAEPSMEMENGCIKVPSKPGLGVEVNEDALTRYKYIEKPTPGMNFTYEHEQGAF